MRSQRGPNLPYSVVASVTPWGSRWVLASAKVHGGNFATEDPRLFQSFGAVLDERPTFAVLVVNAPIGYRDTYDQGPRTCEREARLLLGPRALTVRAAPTWAAIEGTDVNVNDHLDAVTAMLLPRYREVANEMSPFRQRMVYEGHPELSFYQLNADTPVFESKRFDVGLVERGALVEQRMPGAARILDADLEGVPRRHLLDAAALLWTARRAFVHAMKRIPTDPEWDSHGLRMEYVY